MIIPNASPTGQMGGGSFHPVFPLVGKTLSKGIPVVAEAGLTVISLVGVGKFFKATRVLSAVDAGLVRLYQTGRVPWVGASTYYPPGWIGPAAGMIGGTISTWFTPDSSSGGGGPGEIPNLHRPPPSIEETGEILSNPTLGLEVQSSPRPSTSKKAGQCPYYLREIRAGRKYWQKGRKVGKDIISKHDRCAKRAGHSGRHSFSGPFHSKGNIISYLKRLHG